MQESNHRKIKAIRTPILQISKKSLPGLLCQCKIYGKIKFEGDEIMARKYTKKEGTSYGRPKKSKEEALQEQREQAPAEMDKKEELSAIPIGVG